jgi:hypothetical protein
MPTRTQSRGSAGLLVACLSAGMALTMATGVTLMTHHPHDTAQATAGPAAHASVARTVGPSTAPTVSVRARHTGPAVTTAFPHTTVRPTPRHVAVRPRHVAAPVQPRVHRVHRVVVRPKAQPAPIAPTWTPRPRHTTCDGWHGDHHWDRWRHWGDHWGDHSGDHSGDHRGDGWQPSRDGCRHD